MQIVFEELRNRLARPPLLSFSEFEKPFVVETDPSALSIGEVLSQKKTYGKVHPIQFGSRTMNASERSYSACEREAFAVLFGLKTFPLYFLSNKWITLITDHQALQNALKKLYIYSRLAR